MHGLHGLGEPVADLHGAVGPCGQLRRGPSGYRRNLSVIQGRCRTGWRGRTRTCRPLNWGVTAAMAVVSASAKRMRAAQAEESATTVIVPRSRLHRFTLLANSGPSAVITATCHADSCGTERARCAKAGSRVEIKSRAVVGLPGRVPCLSRWGLLGIVSRLLALRILPMNHSPGHRERTTRMPAVSKSLTQKEQG